MHQVDDKDKCRGLRITLAAATFLALFALYSLARECLCPFGAAPDRARSRLTGDEPSYLLTAQALASGHGEDVSKVNAAMTYTNYWDAGKRIIGDKQWTYDNYRRQYGVKFRFDRRSLWGDRQILHGGPLEPLLCAPFALSPTRPRWKILLVQGLLAALAGALLVLAAPGGRKAAIQQAAATVFVLGGAPVVFYTAQIFPETIMGVLLVAFLMLIRFDGVAPRCLAHACLFLSLFGSSRIAGAAFAAEAVCLVRAARNRRWAEIAAILLGAAAYFGYHLWRWGDFFPPNTDANSPITPALMPRGFLRYIFGNSCGMVPLCPVAWAALLSLIPLLRMRRQEPMAVPCAVLSLGIAMSVAMFPTFRAGRCAAGRYQVACIWALLPSLLISLAALPRDSRWGRRLRLLVWTLGPASVALSAWLSMHPRWWHEYFHPFFKPLPLQRFYVLLPDFSGSWVPQLALMLAFLLALTFASDIARRKDTTVFWRAILRHPSWLLLLAGSAHLAWSARQAAYSPSMDYAVVVDMARNMASGLDFPTFFYGQAYMGSLEPAVSAILCAVFGPHPFWVCMGSALLGVATLFAVMRIARRLGGEAAACAALAFAICGGANWTHFTVSPRGGYALASLLCLLAVHMGAVVEFEDKASGRMRAWPAAAFGLAAGLAFWNFWIAAPAFAAACVAILARYRAKAMSWRILLPAAVAFFLASSPWWAWTFRNGPVTLDMNPGILRPPGLGAASSILGVVAARFFCMDANPAGFWGSPFPWPLVAIALFALSRIGVGRDATVRRFVAVTALYAAFFYLMYAFTSFGASNTARYFVHFVPAFSVAGGAAIGDAMRGWRTPGWSLAAAAAAILLAAWAIFTAPRSLRSANALMSGLHADGVAWADSMRKAADDPSLSQPAFADFPLFGANWVTNRRLCFASPLRWRYAPYLLRLEEAESPSVINNSQGFREFCESTQGRCRERNIHGLIVADQISPPPELQEVPAPEIAGAAKATPDGSIDIGEALLDDNLGTFVTINDSQSSIELSFDEPRMVAGVTAILTYSRHLCGWRAEAPDADGGAGETLARCNPIGGWFWSGPRPFMFGPDHRLELRWAPRPLSRIRIVFEGRDPSSPLNRFVAAIADLRPLSSEALPPIDAIAVEKAVGELRYGTSDVRVHAGRWLGPRVGAEPDPALALGHDGGSLSMPAVCGYATIDVESGAIAVLRGGAADAAEATLRSIGLDYGRHDAGGCAIFRIAAAKGGAGTPPLRFYGGRILRDVPPPTDMADPSSAITFGGAWRLQPVSAIPPEVHPGDTLPLEFILTATDIGRCSTRRPLVAWAHGVRDGRMLLVGSTTIDTSLAVLPADAPTPIGVTIPVEIPPDTAPGPMSLMLCVTRQGRRMRLMPRGEDLRSNKLRAILADITVVAQ